MKNKIKNIISKEWLISALIALIVMILALGTHHIEPFGNKSIVTHDCLNQFYPFLCVFYDKLKNGESLYYYWNSGLGANFLLNYVSHLTSPLNLLVVFVKREHITSFITFLITVKIVLSAGTFSFYLSKKRASDSSKFINISISTAYALSNFALCYSHEIMWLDAYLLLPIIIYGFELLMRDRKPYVYIISLSLCAFCNAYPTYFIAIFLIILFLLYEHKGFNDFIKSGFIFAGTSILAAGMTFITMYISLSHMSMSYASNDSFKGHMWYGNIFEVIRYQFLFSKPTTISYDYNHANLYCGTFIIVLSIIYIFLKDIDLSVKIKHLSLLTFLLISMDESILNYFWHGFHYQTGVPNRFSFLFVFLILSISYDSFCNMNKENIRRIIIGAFLAEIIPFICYFFVDYDSYILSKNVMLISHVLIFLYSIVIILLSQFNKKSIFLNSFFFLMIALELYVNAGYMINHNSLDDNIINLNNYLNSIFFDSDVVEEQKDYRSEIINQGPNTNACIGIKGESIFSSSYSFETYTNLFDFGRSTTGNSLETISYVEPIDDLLGIKYIITLNEDNIYENKKRLKRIFNNSNLNIYENLNALPIIYPANKEIADYKADPEGDVYNNLNSLVSKISGADNIFEEIYPDYDLDSKNCTLQRSSSKYLEFIYETDNPVEKEISISFNVPEDGEYSFYFGNDGSGYNVQVKINDEYYYENVLYTCLLQNLGLRNKNDKIEVIIKGSDSLLGYTNMGMNGLCGFLVARTNEDNIDGFVKKVKNNPFVIDTFKDGYIKGSVTLDSDQILFSTIPFDKEWHVFNEKGEELQIQNYAGFIGVELEQGNHVIEYKYIPKGLKFGFLVTALSWITFIFVSLICYKNMKNKNDKEMDGENNVTEETDSL